MTLEVLLTQLIPPAVVTLFFLIVTKLRRVVLAGVFAVVLTTGLEWLAYSSHMGWFDQVFWKNLAYLVAINSLVCCITSGVFIFVLRRWAKKRGQEPQGDRE